MTLITLLGLIVYVIIGTIYTTFRKPKCEEACVSFWPIYIVGDFLHYIFIGIYEDDETN